MRKATTALVYLVGFGYLAPCGGVTDDPAKAARFPVLEAHKVATQWWHGVGVPAIIDLV